VTLQPSHLYAIALLAGMSLCSDALAQQQPEEQEHVSLRFGREAMAKQNFPGAYEHFLYGLARVTDPFPVVALLLQNAAAAGDGDAQALWAHDLYAYGADERGRLNLGLELKATLPEDDPWPSALSSARSQAVKELEKFRGRQAKGRGAGDPYLAEWAEDLARSLALESPALQEKFAADLTPAVEVTSALQRDVLKALMKAVRKGFAESNPDLTVRAARSLRGLGAQSRFKDQYGPPSLDMEREISSANASLARAREILKQRSAVLTVEDLEEFDEDQQRAFTLDHASFAAPGVAVSPTGKYRVETSCGYWTLLGTASTVEDHHERLAAWYGEDPFEGRPGTMRIVPESHGLEMEGAGYWWVGGFQGGDTTTLAFTLSTIPALGRGITHELTHRFDGALYGGLPGWLGEGRAVWTGAHYGSMYERTFIDDYLNFGTMSQVLGMGYGGLEKLTILLDGENEEYRDNYSAGYALFAYLRSWTGFEEGGSPLFRAQLEKYQEDRNRSRGGGAAGFAAYFADGKNGRPEDMETFAADFERFLRGFYWKDMQPWTGRYDPRAPSGDESSRVMDEPTATWLRRRAEPWFGQDQARMGAEALVDAGDDRGALKAYLWALSVDEPSDAVLEEIAAALDRTEQKDAAWVLRHWHRFDAPRRDYLASVAEEEAPFLDKLPQTVELVQQREAAAEFYREKGLLTAAAAMSADAARLARALGLPQSEIALPEKVEQVGEGDTADDSSPPPPPPSVLHPFHRPAHQLGLAGWTEDDLTGHETRRVEGLWYIDHQGDVHVGRNEPRGGTDTMDRNAHYRDAFVLSKEWQDPGRYRLRTKIEQTTSFFHGGVTIGWTRRDRNLRFDFLGGDSRYAAGESDSRDAANGFQWSIDGLYSRKPAVRGGVGFDSEKTTWDLELLVDGPTLEVFVDGKLVGRMTTLDARPIQGYFGFYTSTGAMRVVAPEITRLDRPAALKGAQALGRGLHPEREGVNGLRDLLDRPVSGLPLSGAGTAIVWFPEESAKHQAELEDGEWATSIQETLDAFLEHWQIEAPSQGVTIVLPEALAAEQRMALRQRYEQGGVEDLGLPRGGLYWATHPERSDLMESGMTVGGWKRPIVLFADPAGILRFARRISRTRSILHRDLLRQLLEYQDHQRSGQAGASD
jgi:hypothetical protein